MGEYPVKVYIYDLSKGLAKSLSLGLLGKQIDGVWHSSIVVYGREYYFSGDGIVNCLPGTTILGEPDSKVDLGVTQVTHSLFLNYLKDMSKSKYSATSYHLVDNNCNSFSNDVAQFLTGNTIPNYITSLPEEIMNTPFGMMIRPMLETVQVNVAEPPPVFNPIPGGSMPGRQVSSLTNRPLGRPLLFDDNKVTEGFSAIRSNVKDNVTQHEFKTISEVWEYVNSPICTWSLGPVHMKVIANLAQHPSLTDKQKGVVCGLFRVALLRDDVVSYVMHDRTHQLMTLLANFPTLNRQVQLSLVRGMCNLSSGKLAQKWMLSTDEWQSENEATSNHKITLKMCVTSLLHEDAEVVKSGTSFSYNLTYYPVSEDVALEIGSAIIQSLIKTLNPPCPETCLETLKACMDVNSEVTGLAAVMGLNIKKFATVSPLCAAVCSQINQLIETFSI